MLREDVFDQKEHYRKQNSSIVTFAWESWKLKEFFFYCLGFKYKYYLTVVNILFMSDR